jgi:AcrR family transcriptional regulator
MLVVSSRDAPAGPEEREVSATEAAAQAEIPAGVQAEVQIVARPLRKDAERNRQRILRAAAEVFTERGLEATLDDVAHHAGVGVGTVYRRFPDKASLTDALFEQRIDLLADLAERAYGEPDAWEGLVSFMEGAAEMMAGDRGLRQMLMFVAHGHDRVSYARDRMRPAVGRLLERAQEAGRVRDDLAATDIPVIEFMLSVIAEHAREVRPEIWRRFLGLWLDALQPARDSYTPLPEPELTVDEYAKAMRTSPLGRHLTNNKQNPVKPPPAPPKPPTAPENTQGSCSPVRD